MPEWGQLPVPRRLLERDGVKDVVRISDARMSGTAFGTVVLHVAPGVGGRRPARGRPRRRSDRARVEASPTRPWTFPADEIEAAPRRRETPPKPHYTRGYGALFLEHVMQADQGCDFDFLRARPGEPAESEPLGLLSGWIGGW